MRKSLWSFRTKHTPRHRIHSIVAITMAFAIDHLTADYVINLFGIPNGPARDWFDVTTQPLPNVRLSMGNQVIQV